MKPYTREIIPDRRQPTFRWSAVFAGATVAITCWVLLQMIGMGIGLATVEVDSAGSLRTVGIGTTVWAAVAPIIALFIGGYIAGRLAATYDQKVGAMHGLVVGALGSLVGLIVMVSIVTTVASAAMRTATSRIQKPSIEQGQIEVAPNLQEEQRQKAADVGGKILLGVGVALLLGVGAGIAGGGIAARRYGRAKHRTEEVPVVPPPAPPPAATTPPGTPSEIGVQE
ncbi:MAG: hypothetical protein HOV81_42780 [Kofleriaceae bacterium]|nr:hypothetical protein [Kofleriaceae bacterium]